MYAELTKVYDSATAAAARVEVAQLRAELEEWKQLIDRREVSPSAYARAEQSLLPRIDEAEKRAHTTTVPPVLADHIGPDAEAKWNLASLDVKRQIIRLVADITLMPSGQNAGQARWYGIPVNERVRWRWLLVPDDEQVVRQPSRPSPLRTLKLRPADANALTEVARHGPFPQKELIGRLGLTEANMSNCVGRLVKRGLLGQQWGIRDLRRGRGHSPMLTLTEAGQQVVATLLGTDADA